MFAKVRETWFPHSILTSDTHIAMDATSRFTAGGGGGGGGVEDAPDFIVGPLRKGEYIEVRVFVHYALRDGLISHIRVGRGGARPPIMPTERRATDCRTTRDRRRRIVTNCSNMGRRCRQVICG